MVLVHRLVLTDAPFDVAEVSLRGVSLRRRHVTNDLAAVQRHPVERSVGEIVDIIPAEFLGEETVHASQAAELRELTRVSKCVGKPESLTSFTEVALEEPLTIEELSDQRLTTRHIGIMLNPATTDGVEASFFDLCFDPVKHVGIVGF